jgi:hypothetical protein
MQQANVKKRSQKTVGDKHAKPSAKADQKKNTVTISRKDYDLLCDFARRALKVIEYLSDPEEIERQRIKVETMERGTFQPRVGWTYMNHWEPVVSAELSRQHERRKEIIGKGTWNASRKGREYNGDFAGIWD